MKCQFCGYEGYDENTEYESGKCPLNVKLYSHYKMNLCDRCVDKINSFHNGEDIDEYWEDKDAISCGLKPFPRHKQIPKYYVCCYHEIEYINVNLKELWQIENTYYESSEEYKQCLTEIGLRNLETIIRAVEKMRKKYENRTV